MVRGGKVGALGGSVECVGLLVGVVVVGRGGGKREGKGKLAVLRESEKCRYADIKYTSKYKYLYT